MWYSFLMDAKELGVHDTANICDVKRALREYSHVPPHTYSICGYDVYSRCIKDNGDSYVELIRFPDCVDSQESAEDFFDAFIHLGYTPSPYDCTGQRFTNWRVIFKRRGNYWAYHSASIDV